MQRLHTILAALAIASAANAQIGQPSLQHLQSVMENTIPLVQVVAVSSLMMVGLGTVVLTVLVAVLLPI